MPYARCIVSLAQSGWRSASPLDALALSHMSLQGDGADQRHASPILVGGAHRENFGIYSSPSRLAPLPPTFMRR
jgi:hypothetical protein